jgi:DNA-binding transcriptional MerR regulator
MQAQNPDRQDDQLPPIPPKRYFTIGEAGDLCGVKTHVLRYWEQEFEQLNPMKRRGNRRYYEQQDVIVIRKIRELLYEKGYTIDGARSCMASETNQTDILKEMRSELESVLELLKI